MELIFYLLYFQSYNDKTINNTFTVQQTTVSAVRNTADGTAALETAAVTPASAAGSAFRPDTATAAGSFHTLRCRQMPDSVTARRIPYSGAYTRSPET